MALTSRDIEILNCLLRYRYVSTIQLHDWFFRGRTRSASCQVLKRLERRGTIVQLTLPKFQNGRNVGYVVYLTPKGAEALAREHRTDVERLGFRRITSPIASLNHWYHRSRMIDFWRRLDLDLTQYDNIILSAIYTEAEMHEVNGKKQRQTFLSTRDGTVDITPDLIFILTNPEKGVEQAYFVEIDSATETIGGFNGTVPVNSLLGKYQRYAQLILDGHWRTILRTTSKSFRVLTVTEDKNRIRTIQDRSNVLTTYSKLFLFSTHDTIISKGVTTSPAWWSLNNNGKQKLLK